MNQPIQPARRRLLAGVAGAGLAAASLAHAAPARSATIARPVTLTAQTTEGPYYFDPKLVRADITEGLPGVPLEVRFKVVDEHGQPYAGARVDIWHCNAEGVYSGYAHQGEDHTVTTKGKTYLRGTQVADAQGQVAFRSIYPGWYEGRATHIHFKVWNGEVAVLTSQFFLPDALNEYLYTQLSAYRRQSVRDTLNSNDGIALQAGDTVLGAVREEANRYIASLDVAVDRSAHPVVDRPPAPGEGPLPMMGQGFPGAGPENGPPGATASGDGTSKGRPPRGDFTAMGGRPPGPPPGGFPGGPGGFHHRALQGEERVAALVPGVGKRSTQVE